MPNSRLLIAQGPTQLLAGLSVWAWEDANAPSSGDEIENIILLGDFYAGSTTERLDALCREIAAPIQPGNLISTHDLDAQFHQGHMSFEHYLAQVKDRIGRTDVMEVLVCRNMQVLNEAALHAFPKARKVCYGDGLGVIDINGMTWSRPIHPGGYLDVDEIICLLPLEATPGVFNRVPVRMVPPEFFIQAVRAAAQRIQALDGLARAHRTGASGDSLLVCLSNLTESGTIESLERELEFYLENLRPHLNPAIPVVVKGHPRETFGQSIKVAGRLRELGFDAYSLGDANVIPAECLATVLPVSCLIPLFSYSAVGWRLLNPQTTIVIGVPPELIERYLPAEIACANSTRTAASEAFLMTTLVTRGVFMPIARSAIEEHLALAPRAPVRIPGACPPGEDVTAAARPDDPGQMFIGRVMHSSKETFSPSQCDRGRGAKKNLAQKAGGDVSHGLVNRLKQKLANLFGRGTPAAKEGTAAESVPSSLLGEAHRLLNEGRGAEALKLSILAGTPGPASAEILHLQGLCLGRVGRHEEALRTFELVLARDPGHVEARAIRDQLAAALARPVIAKVPTEQRPWHTTLPRETLLGIQQSLHNYHYRGVPLLKNPFDFAIYPMLVWKVKPATIFEIGSKSGGSALWFGDMVNSFGIDSHVYSLDIVKVDSVSHPRVTFMEANGRCLDETLTPGFLEGLPRPWLVIEDADHAYETSIAVLRFFHPMLQVGEYIVVEDGVISDLTEDAGCNSGPHRALKEFLKLHQGHYEIDGDYCDFFGYNVTWCTNGFLKKIGDAS